MPKAKVLPVGERAILVEFGDDISPDLQAQVAALAQLLEDDPHAALAEWVPTYRSLLIYYDPQLAPYGQLAAWLEESLGRAQVKAPAPARRVTIPVLYGGAMGPDLEAVAAHTGLNSRQLIELHQAPDYLVYMLGFLPGFPYLGGLDPRLYTPRLSTPRTRVAAGSVGIADKQTGIYPLSSPGGWQLIGRTPLRLFDQSREQPFLLRAGDILSFRAIDEEEFAQVLAETEEGQQ